MKRRLEDRPAQISFTSDYHELVEGDLRAGKPLAVRYDPDRVNPPHDYMFGDPRWPFTATFRFLKEGPVTRVLLEGELTPLPDRDPMGQGSMLTASVDVPGGAQFIEMWFKGELSDGAHWDSEHGNNFWFRFPYQDIPVITGTVTPNPDGMADLRIAIETDEVVHGVVIRYYDMSTRVRVKREEALSQTGRTAGGHLQWQYSEQVAADAIIRFKLYYWVSNRRYKDDNSSEYYIAERPEMRQLVPPPPEALVVAARAWQEKFGKR